MHSRKEQIDFLSSLLQKDDSIFEREDEPEDELEEDED